MIKIMVHHIFFNSVKKKSYNLFNSWTLNYEWGKKTQKTILNGLEQIKNRVNKKVMEQLQLWYEVWKLRNICYA